MARLVHDQVGERFYETGVSKGVLFLRDSDGEYEQGVVWNGLTAVNETPTGAESNKQYADNIVYLNLISNEEFEATIEAFTYPDEFELCNGGRQPVPGLTVGQQTRQGFGFAWQSLIGNDTIGTDFGTKLHLVYGAMAGASDKNHATVNESPEAATLSWSVTTTPETIDLEGFRPTAKLTIDSTKVTEAQWNEIIDTVYGTDSEESSLPSPTEVIQMLQSGTGGQG